MKLFIKRLFFIPVALICINIFVANGQGNERIIPPGLKYEFNFDQLETHYLPHSSKDIEDAQTTKEGTPLWAGFSLKTEIPLGSDGTIIKWPSGEVSWMLRLTSPGAPALGLVIEEAKFPSNAILYLYSEFDPNYIYALSAEDIVSGFISTPQLPTESLIVEYTEKQGETSQGLDGYFVITDLIVIYNGLETAFGTKDLGDSDWCQININCSPEGDNWQFHKRGVARMIFRVGTGWYYCTGTLINNTNQDGTPYFLTAEHCGGSASAADRNVWQFYFNYERPGCANTGTPPMNVLTGCALKSKGLLAGGSDFQLVQLNSTPPQAWNPYYNGWDRNTAAATGGVGIHHPSGDAKKISTFNGTLVSSSPNISGSQMASNSAWRVIWSATTNGHACTEGGSSGSPLFNNAGLVVGTLTGGSSYCNAPSNPDFYGKFSYHWLSNGTTDAQRLEPWLDPANTGVSTLPGYDPYGGINPNFIADKTVAFIGEDIVFTDLSSGDGITSWSWNFGEGANPATATGQGPHTVTYTTIGHKTVSLTINGEETETKEDYIFIKEPSNTYLLYEHSPNLTTGGAATSTHTGAINYEVADNYPNITGVVERVVVQGIYAYHDGSAWNVCTPEANINFNINFYEPSSIQPNWDNPIYEFTAGSDVSTYGTWGNWTVYEWDIELPGQAVIDGEGWVSVQAYNSTCWFLWFRSNDGDDYAYQIQHTKNTPEFATLSGDSKDAIAYDLAFQLWAKIDLATITAFDFEEEVLVNVEISPLVNNEGTVLAVVELGTDLTALTPIISISEGATINPPSGVLTDFSEPVVYTVTSEDGETVNTYTVTVIERDLYTDAYILSFDFEEDVLLDIEFSDIVAGEANINIIVANGTDITSLTPTITVSEGATIYPEPIDGVFEAMDFTEPQEFVITAEDGTTQTSYTVNVIEEPPVYSVTFVVVNESEESLSDAIITLNDITNEANDYLFEDLLVGTYDYSVALAGYYTAYGSVTITDEDITETVTLEEIHTYTVTFVVVDENEDELTGAVITLGTITNGADDYVFEGITAGNYNYSVVLAGYVTKNGTITVVDENITETVVLIEDIVTYTVTFNILDKNDEPLSGATITLGEITNDPDDYEFTVEAGSYDYTVVLSGYHSVSSELNVIDQNITETVTLILLGAEINSLSSVQVFPNPFGEHLTISNTQEIRRIVITNLIGLQVFAIDVNQNEIITIPTKNLAAGVFLITLVSNNGEKTVRKIIKR
jgi:PKD repeat protein